MRDQLFEVFGIPEEYEDSSLNGEIVSIVGLVNDGEKMVCGCDDICHEGVLISTYITCSTCGNPFNAVIRESLRPINNPELDKVDQSINKIVEGVVHV